MAKRYDELLEDPQDGESLKLAPPKKLCYFSLDRDQKFLKDPFANLRYVNPRIERVLVGCDLNFGYETWPNKPHKSNILPFLELIMNNSSLFVDAPKKRLAADFVINRGMLKLIFNTVQNRFDNSWSVLVTKFQGTFYCLRFKLPEKKMNSYWMRATYYGLHFEDLATIRKLFYLDILLENDYHLFSAENPNKKDEESNPYLHFFDSKSYAALSSRIGKFNLVYSAEIDAVDDEPGRTKSLDDNLVKIHTRQEMVDWKLAQKYEKWWIQSYLTGVKNIYCGVLASNGRVKWVEKLTTVDLETDDVLRPKKFKFLHDFLVYVDKSMENVDCPDTVFRFNYDKRVSKHFTCQRFGGKNEYSFLTEKYVDFVENL